jgi:chromosomal replication initiator protein
MVGAAREGGGPLPAPAASYTFALYLETDSNRMALTAARAATAQPGTQYNPLVVTGLNGVGKTHLLHAIGNALAERPDAVVACLSAQRFLDDYVEALDRGRLDAWRARYRRATAFLLDDVHLLALKPGSQEELFHLFNVLADGQRQLVFTASGPPQTIDGLDERLVTRLQGGLVVDLPPADRDVRSAVAQREMEGRLGVHENDVVGYLAERPDASLHTLVETVQRVAMEVETSGDPLDLALVRRVVEGAVVAPMRTRRSRGSGVVLSPLAGVRSPEKVIWRWPHVGERLIEDLR